MWGIYLPGSTVRGGEGEVVERMVERVSAFEGRSTTSKDGEEGRRTAEEEEVYPFLNSARVEEVREDGSARTALTAAANSLAYANTVPDPPVFGTVGE